ncbi:MAG: ATP-dependent Clp protease ATP-binding subunit, partial [Clostridia bacterium]|nr:ATP-dependent Clp protease ATP-binding subunit [Clostridia bacterium]
MIASKFGFREIYPAHILMAILDTPSVSSNILMTHGVNPREAFGLIAASLDSQKGKEPEGSDIFSDLEKIYHAMQSGGEDGASTDEPQQAAHGGGKLAEALKGLGEDLTEKAKQDKLDPVIGRKNEIERIIQILSRRTKNNPVLIGEPGVGKTAIVEGLAQAIVSGNVPETLKNKRIFTLDITGVVAGTKYRGEFEEKLKNAIDAIKEAGDIIVFIDEIHMLVGAGAGSESSMDAANILKPMLARGELQVVGATTLDEYRKNIEKDAALERRFQPIMVDPPSVEDTITILHGLREKYEAHHKVRITDGALKAAAELSDRYITDRYLPDKAIDLIDEAASRKRIRNYTAPDDITKLETRIAQLDTEIQEAVRKEEYGKAAVLKDEKEELQVTLSKSKLNWSSEVSSAQLEITEEDIAEIVSKWTVIPVVKLTEAEADRLMNLETEIGKRVVGQRE